MANVKINKDIKAQITRGLKASFKTVSKLLKEEILNEIEKGKSPVKGVPRFIPYSKTYRDAIKRGYYSQFGKKTRPVNLKLSGKMLRSIKIRFTAKGFTLFFADAKAEYHQEGGGKLPRRQMLPEPGQDFNKQIEENIVKAIEKELKKRL